MPDVANSTWADDRWMQDGLDKLRETLDVDAHVRNQMIEFLYESKMWDRESLTFDAAVSRWNANMNPAKPGFFKLAELVALSLAFKRFQFLAWWNEQAGFETREKPTLERQNAILERVAAALENNNEILTRADGDLRRLGSAVPKSAVHPKFRDPEHRPAFRHAGCQEVDYEWFERQKAILELLRIGAEESEERGF
jgi:hypothetical protein